MPVRLYTPKEDKIIVREISRASINLTVVFERASYMLVDRSVDSVIKRWYNVLSKREVVFASISGFSVATNRKNAARIRDRRGELSDEILELAFPGRTRAQKLRILDQIVNGSRR